MFTLDSVFDEIRQILGIHDEKVVFSKVTQAVSILANGGELDGWTGYLDLCTHSGGTCITLPREVGAVLAIAAGGQPLIGRDFLFQFHLNGMAGLKPVPWSWVDTGGSFATFSEFLFPTKIYATSTSSADDNKQLTVFGFDDAGRPLGRNVSGEWVPGIQVVIKDPPVMTDELVSRITSVRKPKTVGSVSLLTREYGSDDGVVLGVYEPDETLPQYRRIILGTPATWVRVAYRKRVPEIRSKYDHIPLASRTALISMIQSLKFRSEDNLPVALEFEADARRLEAEAQVALSSNLARPLQIHTADALTEEPALEA
jgi:hypothetical protein